MGGQWNEGMPDHQDLHHHLGPQGEVDIGVLHQGALCTSDHQKEGGMMMMAGPLDQVVGAS